MKILCAWCLKEGKPALMGEKAPLDDATETHGLCAEHRRQVELEISAHIAEAEALRKKVDP